MTTDAIKRRGAALEDEFFRRVDEKLAQALREKWQHEREIEALKRESQIRNEEVLEELLNAGIQPGTIRATTLIPAVHVAWANGYIDIKEREAVLHAAHGIGITEDSNAGHLLISWLDHKPTPELFQAWQDYITELQKIMAPASYRHLHETAVDTARRIAQAAGGYLGVHSVSVAEERVIRDVDETFLQAT